MRCVSSCDEKKSPCAIFKTWVCLRNDLCLPLEKESLFATTKHVSVYGGFSICDNKHGFVCNGIPVCDDKTYFCSRKKSPGPSAN